MSDAFSKKNGFGEYEDIAVELLKDTIRMLNEFNINYLIISGTLLGCMRHNDFIPWDDDIDLIVDKKILKLIPLISQKYENIFNVITRDDYIVKTCYNDKVKIIDHDWKKYNVIENRNYCWPYVDMFMYEIKKNDIFFFNKNWNIKHFFPLKQKLFKGLMVNIPLNPYYFLKLNYGDNCMTICKSNNYCHKDEKSIKTIYTCDIDMCKKNDK